MFTGEASPEATEGNSPLKATKHSTRASCSLLQSMLLCVAKHQNGLKGCEVWSNLAGHLLCGVFVKFTARTVIIYFSFLCFFVGKSSPVIIRNHQTSTCCICFFFTTWTVLNYYHYIILPQSFLQGKNNKLFLS